MLADVLVALERRARDRARDRRHRRGARREDRDGAAKRSPTPLEVLRDPTDHGHSEAATLGIIRAKALGATCAALLPGDCPLLDPAELDAALAGFAEGRVGVATDRHGTGTNGLFLSPADAIGPAFGPGSRERHLDRARRAGYEARSSRHPLAGARPRHADDLDALVVAPGRKPEAGAR